MLASRASFQMAQDADHSSLSSDDEKALLFNSLQLHGLHEAQKQKRRSTVILAALCILLTSSVGGISLAAVLMVYPVESQACVSRDLVLFAACFSILYIGVHIRGAVKNCTKTQPGPPQLYGNDLHATAIVVERLSIVVWVAALIATAVMMADVGRFTGFAAKVPYLNLVICIGAL